MLFTIWIASEPRGYVVERNEISRSYRLESLAMFCPRCRKTWAETCLVGRGIWRPVEVSCENCNWKDDRHPVPGTILYNSFFPTWDATDWELLELLPPELLKREFDLHLKAFSC